MNFIRNSFVEDKVARRNKANFMSSKIPTYYRFDKLQTVENTQNDVKFDDAIETDVSKARQIPFIKSSKSTVKRRPEVVINKYLKTNISLVKRIKMQNADMKPTLMQYMTILKKILEKLLLSLIVYQEVSGCANLNQCTYGVARLKSFPGAASKELAHYVVPTLKEESFHTAMIHVGINDISRDQSELQQHLVLQNIMKISHQCKDHGVKEIFNPLLLLLVELMLMY